VCAFLPSSIERLALAVERPPDASARIADTKLAPLATAGTAIHRSGQHRLRTG
jgi:hypothetical protein